MTSRPYDPDLDAPRLTKQMQRVFDLMADGRWRTLREISQATGDPEASVSAQLRHLRHGRRFGQERWTPRYPVERRRRGNPGAGLWEYRVLLPVPARVPVSQELPW